MHNNKRIQNVHKNLFPICTMIVSFLSIASVIFFTDPPHVGATVRGYGHQKNDFHRIQMSRVLSRELSDKSEYPWDEVGLLLGTGGDEHFGYSVAISDETDAVAVGSLKVREDYKGGVSVFEKAENNTWQRMGETLLGESFERTGWNVEMSKDGKTLAYGDPKANDYTGVVNILNWDDSTSSWNQMGSTIMGTIGNFELSFIGNGCGDTISLSDDGTTIAVGGCHLYNTTTLDWNSDASDVRVYSYNNADWELVGTNITSGNIGDNFALSMSLSGDGTTVAVGSFWCNEVVESRLGCVRIFRIVDGDWTQIGQELKGQFEFMSIGKEVSLNRDGKVLATSGTEFVRVYRCEGERWESVGEDIYGGSLEADSFGNSISLSDDGNVLAIGAPQLYTESAKGFAMVLRYCEDEWRVASRIEGLSDEDEFGFSIDLSGDGKKLVMGAKQSSLSSGWNPGGPSGYARVFQLEPGLLERSCPTESAPGIPFDLPNNDDSSGSSRHIERVQLVITVCIATSNLFLFI